MKRSPDNFDKISAGGPQPGLKIMRSLRGCFNSLTGFFAPSQDVIGVDIGSSCIKILQLQRKSKKYIIRKCITRALPLAVKDNYAEKRKLAREFVKEFTAESRSRLTPGRLALSGKGVYIFSISVPFLNKKDLRGAVGIELKKRLPFQLDLSRVMFEYFAAGQFHQDKSSGLQLTCIAADRQVIDEEVRFLKEMNIRPVAINAIPDALGNLLPYCFEDIPPKKTFMLLDLGANISLLNFYSGRSLVFCREVPIAGDHFTHALAKPVNSPSGQVNVSLEEAEKLKRNIGIPAPDQGEEGFPTEFGVLKGEQLSGLLRPTLERLAMEINRTIGYYIKTFKPESPVDELYLTGGSSRLRNIDKFLLSNLEGVRKVERLNILNSIKGGTDTAAFKKEPAAEQAMPHLAAAFGLCLGPGGKINLLPPRERLEQKFLFVSTVLRTGLPLILVLSLVFYALNYGNALKYKMLIIGAESEISRLEKPVARVREYAQIKQKLEERNLLVESAQGRQPYWLGLFKEISRLTPQEIVLQKIYTSPGKDGLELHLSGRVFAKYSMADLKLSQYVQALSGSPYFSQVKTAPSGNDPRSPGPAVDFEINCRLNY